MSRAPLGDQELLLLKHVAEHGPMTVGQAAEGFGAQQGLARSTVLTVMERLRKKGYLTRKQVDGVFRYASRDPADTLLRNVVGEFVRKSLAGSVSPFVSYLAETNDVSDDELAELEQLVEKLQAKKRGDR